MGAKRGRPEIIDQQKAWSFSALNNFETCPKKFWHLRVQKDYKEEEGEAILYGKRVHKALELWVKRHTPLPSDLERMASYVQKFVDFSGKKLTEQQLAITSDFVPCSWRDWNNAWCRVVIDLALVGERSAVLVDYKTGRMKDDEFTQLKLAAAVFMIHHPEVEKVTVGYLWTEHDGVITKEVYTRDEILEIWNQILPRVARFNRAHQRDEFPATPSGICRKWCPVTSCPHHGS